MQGLGLGVRQSSAIPRITVISGTVLVFIVAKGDDDHDGQDDHGEEIFMMMSEAALVIVRRLQVVVRTGCGT